MDVTQEEIERDAHQYRLAQARRMIELFTEAHHGRGPANGVELGEWLNHEKDAGRIPPGPINPYPQDH